MKFSIVFIGLALTILLVFIGCTEPNVTTNSLSIREFDTEATCFVSEFCREQGFDAGMTNLDYWPNQHLEKGGAFNVDFDCYIVPTGHYTNFYDVNGVKVIDKDSWVKDKDYEKKEFSVYLEVKEYCEEVEK